MTYLTSSPMTMSCSGKNFECSGNLKENSGNLVSQKCGHPECPYLLKIFSRHGKFLKPGFHQNRNGIVKSCDSNWF